MNPPKSRLRRTKPERSGPIRNAITSPPPGAPEAASAREPIASPPPNAPMASAQREPMAGVSVAVCGALENGVRTAYAVIDDYMRRGQDAARSIFNDPARQGTMSDNQGNFPGGFNPWNPAAMSEQWMMAMRAWSQAWSAFVPGGWPMPGMNPFAAAASPAPRISVKVSSAIPVEVTANLLPGTDSLALIADPLHAEGFKAPPIEAPEIVREPGTVKVSVKVDSKQPAGRYHGSIRKKADGGAAGDLTVIVS